MKLFLLIAFASMAYANTADMKNVSGLGEGANTGGSSNLALDDKTANEILKTNLARLVSGTGGAVTVVKINSITHKIVAGTLYEYVGSFKVGEKTVDCHITAWSRPWLDDENEKLKIKAECGKDTISAKNDDGDW